MMVRAVADPNAEPTTSPAVSMTVKITGPEARAILVAYANLESLEAERGAYQPLELYKYVIVTDEGQDYDVLFLHVMHVTPTTISGIHGANYDYKIRKRDFVIEGFTIGA
jgi:hypothetical protein